MDGKVGHRSPRAGLREPDLGHLARLRTGSKGIRDGTDPGEVAGTCDSTPEPIKELLCLKEPSTLELDHFSHGVSSWVLILDESLKGRAAGDRALVDDAARVCVDRDVE